MVDSGHTASPRIDLSGTTVEMCNTRTTADEFEYMRGFEDPDLTPKPLRIVKRRIPERSGIVNVSPALSTSSTQRTLVPTRSSSISSASTHIELSRLYPTLGTTSCSGRRGSFQMRKQRQRNPVNSSTTGTSIRSGVSTTSTIYETRKRLPHCRNIFGMAESGTARRSSHEVPATTATRPTGSRAFTIGAFHTKDLLNPVNAEPRTLAQTPTAIGGRRTMTAVANCRRNEAAQNEPGLVLRREPSFKYRLITRMIGGLSHKSHSGHAAVNDSARNPLDLGHISHSQPQVLEAMDSSSRTSSSSERTDTINSALAAFPTPPTSNEASPTTFGSFSSSRLGSRRYRELCKPEEAVVMGAELRLTAEYDELSSDTEQSMLVAIDIEGTMNKNTSGQNLWSQHTGLDVAVIIDNSLYTSPSMLMASCETTRALASILNMVTDRLAVLCTSPINDHRTLGADFTKIWPLSSIKPQKLKTVLDAVVNTNEVPSASSWEDAIESAREILLQSTVPDADAEILQDTFGLVIILTANVEELPSSLLSHDRIQFHVVCPAASVARNDFSATDCNGWKLRSMVGNEPRAVRVQKHAEPTTLLNRLRDLFMHARGGQDAGKLTYLSLDIKPGPKCRIESVMGKSEYLMLHPGELRTILVRLRVPACKAQGMGMSRSATLPALGQYSTDIQDELDKMLRVPSRPANILTARLKYKHSFLSSNTTCSVVAECSLKRGVANPVEIMQPENLSTEKESRRGKEIVHERLAYHIATQGGPVKALSAFRDEFGDEGRRSHCPAYTQLVLNELRYQARITERLEINTSPRKPTPKCPSQIVSAGESSRPDSWYTKIPDNDAPASPRVQLITLSDLRKATKPLHEMHAELKQARILSDNTRKSSRGSIDLSQQCAVSMRAEEGCEESLKQVMVVRHQMSNDTVNLPKKRGIKAAAMKRITSAGESLGKGLGGS